MTILRIARHRLAAAWRVLRWGDEEEEFLFPEPELPAAPCTCRMEVTHADGASSGFLDGTNCAAHRWYSYHAEDGQRIVCFSGMTPPQP